MHCLRMSYGFVTVLVGKLHYTTALLRYDTLPFLIHIVFYAVSRSVVIS